MLRTCRETFPVTPATGLDTTALVHLEGCAERPTTDIALLFCGKVFTLIILINAITITSV